MTTATARISRPGHTAAKPPRTAKSRERALAWARRAPLLPALIFLIVVTQLPFVVTLIISFLNWNSLSPTKTAFTQTESPSPPRVVAQVPSTIMEQPLFEEPSTMENNNNLDGATQTSLRRAETIRIYADNDVYSVTALLLDVENAITKMGSGDASPVTKEEPAPKECSKGPSMAKEAPVTKDVAAVRERSATRDESLSDAERKKMHRTRSHGFLRVSPAAPVRKPVPGSKLEPKTSLPSLPCVHQKLEPKTSSSSLPSITTTSATTSNVPDSGPLSPQIFLTSAVFKP